MDPAAAKYTRQLENQLLANTTAVRKKHEDLATSNLLTEDQAMKMVQEMRTTHENIRKNEFPPEICALYAATAGNAGNHTCGEINECVRRVNELEEILGECQKKVLVIEASQKAVAAAATQAIDELARCKLALEEAERQRDQCVQSSDRLHGELKGCSDAVESAQKDVAQAELVVETRQEALAAATAALEAAERLAAEAQLRYSDAVAKQNDATTILASAQLRVHEQQAVVEQASDLVRNSEKELEKRVQDQQQATSLLQETEKNSHRAIETAQAEVQRALDREQELSEALEAALRALNEATAALSAAKERLSQAEERYALSENLLSETNGQLDHAVKVEAEAQEHCRKAHKDFELASEELKRRKHDLQQLMVCVQQMVQVQAAINAEERLIAMAKQEAEQEALRAKHFEDLISKAKVTLDGVNRDRDNCGTHLLWLDGGADGMIRQEQLHGNRHAAHIQGLINQYTQNSAAHRSKSAAATRAVNEARTRKSRHEKTRSELAVEVAKIPTQRHAVEQQQHKTDECSRSQISAAKSVENAVQALKVAQGNHARAKEQHEAARIHRQGAHQEHDAASSQHKTASGLHEAATRELERGTAARVHAEEKHREVVLTAESEMQSAHHNVQQAMDQMAIKQQSLREAQSQLTQVQHKLSVQEELAASDTSQVNHCANEVAAADTTYGHRLQEKEMAESMLQSAKSDVEACKFKLSQATSELEQRKSQASVAESRVVKMQALADEAAVEHSALQTKVVRCEAKCNQDKEDATDFKLKRDLAVEEQNALIRRTAETAKLNPQQYNDAINRLPPYVRDRIDHLLRDAQAPPPVMVPLQH